MGLNQVLARDGSPHPASSHLYWENGWAKRSPNFDQVTGLAETWQWSPGVGRARTMGAIILGTPDLTAPERAVLLSLVSHLDDRRLQENDAKVFPSARRLSRLLGCSESSVRAIRRQLEVKGWLIRDYNKYRNTPLKEGFIDLAPTLARLDEMEGHVSGVSAEMRAEYDEAHSSVVYVEEFGAGAPESWRLKQSPKNEVQSVTGGSDAPAARQQFAERRPADDAERTVGKDSGQGRASAKPSANGLPRKARSSPEPFPAPLVATETLRKELELALRVMPALKPLLPPSVMENPASAPESTLAQLQNLAAEVLGHPARNNDRTVEWAWQRHRIRAAAFLAIAVHDAKKDPCNYFGWFTCQPREKIRDLRSNLLRIIEAGPPAAAPSVYAEATTATPMRTAPGHDTPEIEALDAAIQRILRDDLSAKSGIYETWFSGLGFDGFDEDGALLLLTPNGVRRDRIAKEYPHVLPAAAAEAGLDATHIELRSVTGGRVVVLT